MGRDQHVIATALQFHHSLAIIALLILVLLGGFKKLDHVGILRACFIAVCPSIAHRTDFPLTLLAPPNAVLDVLWLDPFPTISCRTVYPVRCRILQVLLVPEFLVLVRDQVGHVLQRDVL